MTYNSQSNDDISNNGNIARIIIVLLSCHENNFAISHLTRQFMFGLRLHFYVILIRLLLIKTKSSCDLDFVRILVYHSVAIAK